MRDLLPEIERWRQAGKQVAFATIAQVYGSALRPLGSKMVAVRHGLDTGHISPLSARD